ncbi:MAG TPA: hypothetical protein ENG40_03965 [Thermoprotei archaeon]|nr:hypothetical protein [Thermoprotei archaeon]
MLRENAEYLKNNTDYAILFHGAGGVHKWGQGLRGWSNWLVDLRFRKSIASAMLDHMIEIILYNLKKLVHALNDRIQIIGFGDDLGIQSRPQVSPKTFKEMLKPYYEEIFGYVKKHSKLYIFFHSCGSIYELIPDLIDTGIDILNPVQISAKNMEPEKLKENFGEQLVFWGGGVDTQKV